MSLKHGHRKGGKTTYLYKAWENVKQRTCNPNHPRFKDWGGRGVTMFPPWRESFMPFAQYIQNTLGERPSPLHSLDRINNSLGYVMGNLKWSTAKEQAANRRTGTMPHARRVIFCGQDYSVNGFARVVGRSHKAISYRLDHGESPEQIAVQYGYNNVATLPLVA
jgi:hypothetical protein